MADSRSFRYPSARPGFNIHARVWLPQGAPRGVIQVVHGMSEHVGRYEEAACFLTSHGFVVCGADHLGHGQTAEEQGERGYFAPQGGWDLVLEDVCSMRDKMKEAYPDLPYFLMGHSMGSFLVRAYLIRYPGTVTGAILSGTGQESPLLVALGKWLAAFECSRLGPDKVSPLVNSMSLGAYNRKFRPNRTRADWISRDPAQVDAYLADPMCRFQPTSAMFRDLMGGLQEIGRPANLKKMDPATPVYFFSGTMDPVGGMSKGVNKVAGLFRQAGCRDVTVHLYVGGRHEMLHEYDRGHVLRDLLAWLNAHLPS